MTVIVLAPGLLCDDRLWSTVRPLLKGRVRTVDFAPDRSMQAMAARILSEGPERFVLAGFSMGGMAALLAAVQAPERIAGLVLIDTHADPETAERSRHRARQIAAVDAGEGEFGRLVREELKPAYFHEPDRCPAERQLVFEMAMTAGAGQFRRHVQALMERPDLAPLLKRLAMPVTVVTGETDALAPPAAGQRLSGLVRNGRFVSVPACGHMAPLEAPQAVADEINRLSCQPEFA